MNKIPVPKISGKISSEKLHRLLKRKLPKAMIYLVDREYQLTTKAEMERFLKEDKTDLIKYIDEYCDCDDRAWTLLGNINSGAWAGIAFGFAFSQVHAFNIFCTSKDIYLIEPQTDEILSIRQAKKIKSGPKKESSPYYPIVLVMI